MHELIIKPGRVERLYWRDLWRYRELFYFLAWRDILVRYKQTVVGVAWALVRPLVTMIVLTVVFGKLAKLPSGGVPYPILVFCGILPWQFFASALSESSNSLVGNANLISKVYFPRLIIPASRVITSMVDFLFSASLLVILMCWYRYLPSPNCLLLPLFIGLAFFRRVWSGRLDFRADGPLSRLSLHRSIRRPIRPLHITSRFLQQHRTGKVALSLLAQSHGGRH